MMENAYNAIPAPEEPEASRVTPVKGDDKAEFKKKSFIVRLAEAFIEDDISNIKHHVIHDVVIPSIKNAINDSVRDGIHMLLFKSTTPPSQTNGYTYTEYSSPTKWSSGPNAGYVNKPQQTTTVRQSYMNITRGTKAAADETLNELRACAARYGSARVADLYGLCDLPSEYTDNSWGWTAGMLNPPFAEVVSVAGGRWWIKVPKAIALSRS